LLRVVRRWRQSVLPQKKNAVESVGSAWIGGSQALVAPLGKFT
jgi:hypothetical protein